MFAKFFWIRIIDNLGWMHQIQPSSFPQPALDVGKGQHTHSVRAGDAVQDEQITAKIQSIVFLLQEARGSTLSSVRTLLAATVTSGPATTTSSIVELIGEHQRQEVSIQQTISEALASISETEGQKSRSNITAEVRLFNPVLRNKSFLIQLRIFRVPDSDPTHIVWAYLEL